MTLRRYSFSNANWGTVSCKTSAALLPGATDSAVNKDQKCIALRSSWESEPVWVGIEGDGDIMIVEIVDAMGSEKSR